MEIKVESMQEKKWNVNPVRKVGIIREVNCVIHQVAEHTVVSKRRHPAATSSRQRQRSILLWDKYILPRC